MISHHPDCDGYRRVHVVSYVEDCRSALSGGSLGHLECGDCDLRVPEVGMRPRVSLLREPSAGSHGFWVECDGRCLCWGDPDKTPAA